MTTSLSARRPPISRTARRGALRALLGWLACTAGGHAYAIDGTDIAYLMNQRYQATPSKCAANRPAWMCAGVLVRPLPGDASASLTYLTESERALGSANVAYLRRDLGTSELSTSAGIIFADGFTAAGWQLPLSPRCVYPVAVAPPSGTPSNGCDLTSPVTRAAEPGSCAAHNVTDAAGWLQHFASADNDPGKQCSLNAANDQQFASTLQAHQAADPRVATNAVVMLLPAWQPDAVQKLPIQAFFYDVNHGGQLPQAQRYQRQYFDATGKWLPILRVAIAAGATSFGFDERDQLDDGERVAARLNARFADVRECPGDQSAFVCSGVIVRITGYGENFHSWNLSPTNIRLNGVATTWMRLDAEVSGLAYGAGEGFAFSALDAPAQVKLEPQCFYPSDGYTSLRETRCGKWPTHPTSASCASLGIRTLSQWQAHYAVTSYMHQCSLGVDKTSFQLGIDARRTLKKPHTIAESWNELILAVWPADIPTSLPIEAIVYTPGRLAGAQYIQQDYWSVTGRFLPVIQVDVAKRPQAPFVYAPADQASADAPRK
ncbi:hypothetical protein [Pandoraea anhela]|uniref:Uncharacterized protein n=1 Tax=Pandoraea anhela TaxID=2508295 RepID=A0A5E4V3S1_9BURK|nr:hypothetical protein [Pandoraea anhela]VVE06866.1 hypothetical protein PAN31108_02418 [Pandoraea anhela]